MRNCLGPWLLLICSLCACQTLELPPQNSRECLAIAQGYLEEGEFNLALLTLDYFDPDGMSLDDQSHWYLIAGTSYHRLGQHWPAYEEIRSFAIKRRFQSYSDQIANLLFELGEALARRNGGFIFWSDRQRAKVVLKELVSYYKSNPHWDDAQYRLGELAYEDRDFQEARTRFFAINADSVWNTKSLFRFAMCHYESLQGPAYDLAEMEQARSELTGFLESKVENPEYRKVTSAALTHVEEMLAEKHWMIAQFYFEIENDKGGEQHLDHAANNFPQSKAGQRASARLEKLREMQARAARRAGPNTEAKKD